MIGALTTLILLVVTLFAVAVAMRRRSRRLSITRATPRVANNESDNVNGDRTRFPEPSSLAEKPVPLLNEKLEEPAQLEPAQCEEPRKVQEPAEVVSAGTRVDDRAIGWRPAAMNPSSADNATAPSAVPTPDAAAVAAALAQLTAGWTPAAGVTPEALAAARRALAASLIAGKSVANIHAVAAPNAAKPPTDPALDTELSRIALAATTAPRPRAIGLVRSARAATQSTPSGRPAWASAAVVAQSFGPFQDLLGGPLWVDVIPLTTSIQFAFVTATSPFGVLPFQGSGSPPASTSNLSLGSGSVWFLASLLGPALPAGSFTGFSIAGGTLSSSGLLTYQNGTYVVPAGAVITVTANLLPLPAPTPSPGLGADAAAATFTPPTSVTIIFRETGVAFQAIVDCQAKAYGNSVTLHWNQQTPLVSTGQPLVVIPCDATPATFSFNSVESTMTIPSGTAQITGAGWGLPLAQTSISTLPEVAGPGVAAIVLGPGVSVVNTLEPQPVAASFGVLDVGTGGIYLVLVGNANPVQTTFQLWPRAAPSQLNAVLEFNPLPEFVFAFLALPNEELLYVLGKVTAVLDRPLNAAGAPFPFTSLCALRLDAGAAATHLFIGAQNTAATSGTKSIALENALIGVDPPNALTFWGTLQGLNATRCDVVLYFVSRWLLPTLPDPYAANFDLSIIPPESDGGLQAILAAGITWPGASAPELAFELLPAPSGSNVAGTPFPTNLTIKADPFAAAGPSSNPAPALLDVSTRVDLFGVAVFPTLAAIIQFKDRGVTATDSSPPAPPLALQGLSLVLNGAIATTFALPQSSWEPMESTAVDESGPIYCSPASDGFPLLAVAPDDQQLVPFSPEPMLVNNVQNVAAGRSFAALFSLPFGLDALIVQPNRIITNSDGRSGPAFQLADGQFALNRPSFPESFVPNPKPPTATIEGAFQLSVVPEHPSKPDASFPGATGLDTAHSSAPTATTGGVSVGYGSAVLGSESGVDTIFQGQFAASGKTPSVPLKRIDFSGYGASIYSEWIKSDVLPPAIVKVQFETSTGRTAYDVIKAYSVIYPYYIQVVRTVTMLRGNAGWVHRSDTGWQAASSGEFDYPTAQPASGQTPAIPDWSGRIHKGALVGAFNVRNISQPSPPDIVSVNGFEFTKVVFDADLGVASSLKVTAGGFSAPLPGVPDPPELVASTGIVGYLQLSPDNQLADYVAMAALFAKVGPLSAPISCTIEVGASSSLPGTTLRCSAFQTNVVTEQTIGALVPALGVALMGAPQIPRGGGWSMGHRGYADTAPSVLPNDFPLPLVQPTTSPATTTWSIADVTDVLQLSQPRNYYSLMHSTGTNKVLFEGPQIPVMATTPGIQFPKPNGASWPGGVPLNAGSPNFGDLASILNSTGLFPDIANAISIIHGASEQIDTIADGFSYTKTYPGSGDPPLPTKQLIDTGIVRIDLAYADTGDPTNQAATLTYEVNSAGSPSWSLSLGPLSFEVIVPAFGNSPVMIITGTFYADEHTKAGLTKLNVTMGQALGDVANVFSNLQTLAQFLPGGAGANLDVAVSNGTLVVSDSFTIGDLPLGFGDLTDISLDLGLDVQLAPQSIDFGVGLGTTDNPFHWIASPLAGNGLMSFGVTDNKPYFTIQAGLGLGLAIDLGIASGSASVAIAVQLNVTGNSITVMEILSGQATVDVLDGLASATITLSAGIGVGLQPLPPAVAFSPQFQANPLQVPKQVTLGQETVTLLASCSVGIHLTVCWVASVNWDGSWNFQQSFTTPQITLAY
jgi:hypothetical protein